MRTASRNSTQAVMAQSIVALKRDMGSLFQSVGKYILGFQMTQQMKDSAYHYLGDIGADLSVLCKMLKVKMPSATKKIKLTCTRTAALLQLDGLTTEMLSMVEAGVFTSPKMVKVKKMVMIPAKGTKEEREVDVVDAVAETTAAEGRAIILRSLLESALDLYWRVCYDITGETPSGVFDGKLQRMASEYPNVQFELHRIPKPPKTGNGEAVDPSV
jgi:hypothetical protein